MQGILTAHGKAKYRHEENSSDSYFIELNNKDVVWGVDLERALSESSADLGDSIIIEFLGKEPVSVPQFKNIDGVQKIVGYVDVSRNSYAIRDFHANQSKPQIKQHEEQTLTEPQCFEDDDNPASDREVLSSSHRVIASLLCTFFGLIIWLSVNI